MKQKRTLYELLNKQGDRVFSCGAYDMRECVEFAIGNRLKPNNYDFRNVILSGAFIGGYVLGYVDGSDMYRLGYEGGLAGYICGCGKPQNNSH